jgi:hypothetical protein
VGEPALEICCDTGLPLLDLLETGLDVPNRDAPSQAPWEIQKNEYEGCRIRVGMTREDWNAKDSESLMKLRAERISLKGQVESVDIDWFRKVWDVDRFCDLLADSGFHRLAVEPLDSGVIQVSADVARQHVVKFIHIVDLAKLLRSLLACIVLDCCPTA